MLCCRPRKGLSATSRGDSPTFAFVPCPRLEVFSGAAATVAFSLIKDYRSSLFQGCGAGQSRRPIHVAQMFFGNAGLNRIGHSRRLDAVFHTPQSVVPGEICLRTKLSDYVVNTSRRLFDLYFFDETIRRNSVELNYLLPIRTVAGKAELALSSLHSLLEDRLAAGAGTLDRAEL